MSHSTSRLGRAVLLAVLAGLAVWSVTHLQQQFPSTLWVTLVLVLWITLLISTGIAINDAFIHKERSVHLPWQTIAAIIVVGLVLGGILAPPLAALRPLPAPITITERHTVYTADLLDTKHACVYTWDDEVFTWTRQHLGITPTMRCPKVDEAKRRWLESLTAPTGLRTHRRLEDEDK